MFSRKKRWKCKLVNDSNEPASSNSIRVICFSDTHSGHQKVPIEWFPPGDIALFAGDFTNVGSLKDTKSFISFYASLPYKYKVLIAGNHEVTYDKENRERIIGHYTRHETEECNNNIDIDSIKNEAINDDRVIYLEDSSVELMGLKIYGSPYSVEFGNWAFPTFDNEKGSRWEKIPNDTDIVLVHGPPYGILDKTTRGLNAGCPYLKKKISKIKPALCVFGHIHEAYGVVQKKNTIYANASVLNIQYSVQNKPIVIDFIK